MCLKRCEIAMNIVYCIWCSFPYALTASEILYSNDEIKCMSYKISLQYSSDAHAQWLVLSEC